VLAEGREVEQEWSGNSHVPAVRVGRRKGLPWQNQSFDRVPHDNAVSAIDRLRFPLDLKLRLWECAEVFIAASGVIAVLMIVLFVAATVRGIQSLRRH
jgi:hypothetical protein